MKEPAADIRDRVEEEMSALRKTAGGAMHADNLDVTVIGLQELREGYARNQKRRELLGSYDLFMCDDRILPMMGKALGTKVGFSSDVQTIVYDIEGARVKKEVLTFTRSFSASRSSSESCGSPSEAF